jgi:hypothetical protein
MESSAVMVHGGDERAGQRETVEGKQVAKAEDLKGKKG